MIIRNHKLHLGDALMILAMMQPDDVYAGTPACNALLMNNVKTIPVEHVVNWDVDVTGVCYSDWEGYAKALKVTWNGKHPKLFVTEEEREKFRFPESGKPKVGVCCWSRDKYRSYPHWRSLVKRLKKHYDVYVFGREQVPIRQLVSQISQMDKLVSVDTGVAHIGGCLGIPLVIIEGATNCKALYGSYDVQYINTNADKCTIKPCTIGACKHANCMYLIYPRRIVDTLQTETALLSQAGGVPIILETRYQDSIALLRLDGLGGTVTLSDHAKKAKEKYDYPITLIVRGYEQLFADNPYVDKVITVGLTDWQNCLDIYKNKFVALADIRFSIAKWYNFEQDFAEWEEMYSRFGIDFYGYNTHVKESTLHHIQVTDKTLGLPYETIDTRVFSWSENKVRKLPDEYICVNNGVDVIHHGVKQTKSWDYWREFVRLCTIPVVQIGTMNDTPIVGTIDMRGKTSIPEVLGVINNSRAVVCTEGGIMHLAYAMNRKTTIVLRGPTRGKLFEYPEQIMVDSYLCDSCVFVKPDWYLRCYADANSVCMKSIIPERVYEAMVTH